MTKKSIDKLVIRLYFSYVSSSVHQNGQSVDRRHIFPDPSTKRANRWTDVTFFRFRPPKGPIGGPQSLFSGPVHQKGQSVDRRHFFPVPSTKRVNRWTEVTFFRFRPPKRSIGGRERMYDEMRVPKRKVDGATFRLCY